MQRQRITITLLFVLILSMLTLAPLHASPPRQEEADAPPIQGEIAYVLDGDIWLHDLLTGQTQQLTDDGDNQWPAWSLDGRFLTYSHGDDLESSDLYLLDTTSGEATLLVENACCADWQPNGGRIAYLALGNELAVEAILPDGFGQETLFEPLTVEGGAYPAGRLVWANDQYLLAPLEYIDQGSLDFLRDVFPIDLYNQEVDSGMRQDDCAVLSRDVVIDEQGSLRSEAIAFERRGDECNAVMQAVSAPKGIDLVQYDDDKEGGELPWLAAPSFSGDGLYLAAERYAESDDPIDAELWGVVVVNLADGSQRDVAANASQPAWRPAPPIDPIVVRFAQPGERIVTIDPPLDLDGVTYRASYLTSGDLKRRDAGIFHLATPQWLADQQVSAFVVSTDGKVVRNAETLRRVFDLYHAAYHLYEDDSAISLPQVGDELDTVLNNPVFMAMEPEQFLRSRRMQTEQALRSLLTDRRSDARLDPFFQAAFQTTPSRLEDGLAALGDVLQDQAAANDALGLLSEDLAQAFDQANVASQRSELGVKALRLMADLLYLSHLQRQRADWLTAYAQSFPRGDGSLDRDQLRAAANVLDEVDNAFQQRVAIAADFGKNLLADTLFKAGKELTVQAASKLATDVGAKYGVEIAANSVASAVSVASVGLTVNGILYGSDALVANFMLARRSEELRQVFQAGREALQEQAAGRSSDAAYDGNLAERFRSAHLLETLAATQAQHAYADGVAATFQLPNPLELLNWLRGEDWRTAVEGLHASADQVEASLLDDLVAATAAGATDLALARLRTTMTVTDPIYEFAMPPGHAVATVDDKTIVARDFEKRVRLENNNLQGQLIRYQQLEEQFGNQGFFTNQINQLQATLASPFALGQQTLDQMIEEIIVERDAASRGLTVSDEEVNQALREEVANGLNLVTEPQATATVEAAVQATATAAGWTPTPEPTIDANTVLTPTLTPTPPPTRAVISDTAYSEGLSTLEQNVANVANMSIDEYKAVIWARLLRDKLAQAIGEEQVTGTEEQVKARHILLRETVTTTATATTDGRTREQAFALANELRQRILAGEDFATLAAEYSDDPGSKVNGGDLGWFGRGAMVAPFEDAAFALSVGEISEPISTTFGVHLIQVDEKDSNRPRYAGQVWQERAQAFQTWLQEQITAANVERNDIFTEPVTGITFVRVPAGEFIMGSSEGQIDVAQALCQQFYDICERGWFESEAPQHQVHVDEFWIGQTEVTNAQWQIFMEAGGYDNQDYWTEAGWQDRNDYDWTQPDCWDDSDLNQPDQPVVCISWFEALAYTRWLAEASGLEVRLPTEAEWEKAARGVDGRIFPWGDEWDGSLLNSCDVNCLHDDIKDETVDDGYAYTAPVGSYQEDASPYGALDMAGNVWEWTSTSLDRYPYAADDGREELEGNDLKILRGGSFSLNSLQARCAGRPTWWYPVRGGDDGGFRVVSSPLAVGR